MCVCDRERVCVCVRILKEDSRFIFTPPSPHTLSLSPILSSRVGLSGISQRKMCVCGVCVCVW